MPSVNDDKKVPAPRVPEIRHAWVYRGRLVICVADAAGDEKQGIFDAEALLKIMKNQ